MAASRTLPLALVFCALALPTRLLGAQPSSTGERAQELIRLRQAAEEHEKQGAYVACAETYLQIAEAQPQAKNLDEVLYNAGVCFEAGKRIRRAIEIFGRLEQRFPRSRVSAKAMIRTGSAAASIAEYAQAADAYERYAKRYAGEKDAAFALADAIAYRRALGHDDEAIADIHIMVKHYKRRKKEESAAALFSLAKIYEAQHDPKKVVRSYERYIREFGKIGGAERLFIAYARIGELLWQQSCVSPSPDGSCVRPRRRSGATRAASAATLPTHCGPASLIAMTVLARDKSQVKEAKRYFAKALAMHRSGAIESLAEERQTFARYWLGALRFYTLEETYEALLSIQFPKGLDFIPGTSKAKESEQRFTEWVQTMRDQSEALQSDYADLAGLRGSGAAPWTLAAIARSGQSAQHFSNLLRGAEIPRSVRRGASAKESVQAYCDALQAAAAPLGQQVVQAYQHCLTRSQDLDHFGHWSRLCEKELARLRPEDFPLPREIHDGADAMGEVLAREPLAADAVSQPRRE